VVRLLGTIAASNNEHWLPNDEDIIRNNITRSQALRLARKLRQQAEDRPEAVMP
jgi:hypothetical protein